MYCGEAGYHTVETVTLADRQPGDTIIGVHPGKDPARIALDVFREILLLGLEIGLLGIFHGGYSGISGNPFCGRLFRGECPGWELTPCNSFLRQCCLPPVRQLVRGIFPQRHRVRKQIQRGPFHTQESNILPNNGRLPPFLMIEMRESIGFWICVIIKFEKFR